jgi:hypothetical protein
MMKWSELDDKERVRLILAEVMGYFVSDKTATGWETPDLGRDVHAPEGFHWPLAFWNTDGECWMIRDSGTDPVPFEPLRDLNDTWMIVESIKERGTRYNNPLFPQWQSHLSNLYGRPSERDMLWDLNPEGICIAALRAQGIEIETEVEQEKQ